MEWIVKNAVNRDVERQHLNKILADIRATVGSSGGLEEQDVRRIVQGMMPTVSSVTPATTVILEGDVTGRGTGRGTVTVTATLDGAVSDAPIDATPYWRNSGNWESVPDALLALSNMEVGGLLVYDLENMVYTTTEITGAAGQIEVLNGDGVQGSPEISLAEVTDAGGGQLRKFDKDTYGRVTGTSDATTDDLEEGTANLYFTEQRAADAAPVQSVNGQVGDVLVGMPKGYIEGLRMTWVGPNAINISSGFAYIPAANGLVENPATIALTGLVIAANTWYHVYLYLDGSTPAVEVVTTAPASPYSGTARAKTGDTSRRYLGSVRSNASAGIIQFQHTPDSGTVTYLGGDYTPRNILSNGTATTVTTLSCAQIVPVTGVAVDVLATNVATSGVAVTGNSTQVLPLGGGASSSYYGYVNPANALGIAGQPLDSSIAFTYRFLAAPVGGALYMDVMGYTYTR